MLKKQNKVKRHKKFNHAKKPTVVEEIDDDIESESDTLKLPKEKFQHNLSRNWYEEFTVKAEAEPLEISDQEKLRKEAGGLFEKEISSNFGKNPKTISKTDYNWIKTVIVKGTMSDKIAAYVLLIQDNPIVNMSYLKNMVSMSKVGKKRECFVTMDTLVELFLDNLLPPSRKLKFFSHHPLSMLDKISKGNIETRSRLLVLWFFEDQLKTLYTAFIRALNDAAHDSVEANKERAVVIMQKLLQGHPEQEAALLGNIVNKLGDPSHKIGSKVIYTLTKLLDTHPNMKGVVMNEVEKVIFRPNMNKRAQYYSICFLTQFTFYASDNDLANNLITIYFSLFKALIKTGDVDSRMMSALLTGVSRAFPYVKSECNVLNEHINTVYKVVHLSSASVAIHALSLLFLVVGKAPTDRFMTVLYKKIGEPGLFNAAHHAMFISIIFKSLKSDLDDGRVCAFIKRLLQTALHLSVPLVCGILMLISQVAHARKKFALRTEVEKTITKLEVDDDDDEEERYHDLHNDIQIVKDSVIKSVEPKIKIEDEELKKENSGSSWYHAANNANKKPVPKIGFYDPYQRNPLHAQGNEALLIELALLTKHYHPTVGLFASNIIQGEKISYSGDPLQDFTLIRFLDKFVFKNPKKVKSGLNQVTTFARFGRKKYYESVGLKKIRVNTAEYLNHDEKTIPVDEAFMYNYSGDPLQDFTLIRFLDKFVFKNPKKVKSGLNQVTTFARFGRKKYYESVGLKKIRVNTAEYLNHDEKTIPVDEAFMYKYLKDKGSVKSLVKEDDDDSDASSVDDDEFDSILNKVSQGQKEDLDFMSEIGSLPANKHGNLEEGSDKEAGSEDDDAEGMEDDDEDGGEGIDDDDDDELGDDLSDVDSNAEDFDGDEMDDFSDGDEMDSDSEKSSPNMKKKPAKNTKKKQSKGLFAAAEEFAELLEDDQFNSGSSSAFSNKDNAAKKQLKWEDNRDRWVKDKNRNKRGNTQNWANKSSKKRTNSQNNQSKQKRRKFN